ncbi:chromogranin-A [Brienomyrus brachyistius]|uniref:chromogranin-A n=1 Tax=Brienomyrus brachyistius TaxID=42636 RepID=UPI0020B2150E|nr:chromogranin-A [Brienomyrus brachyistius]
MTGKYSTCFANMIATGCLVFAFSVISVSSHPVSPGFMGKPVSTVNHPDPSVSRTQEVMKCIVEVLTDTLSKPQPIAVRKECLDVLSRDETVVSVLQHKNFLQELQEFATQGVSEASRQQLLLAGGKQVTSELGDQMAVEPTADQAVPEDLGVQDSERGGVARRHEEGLQWKVDPQVGDMIRDTEGHKEDEDKEEHQKAELNREKSVSLSWEEDEESRMTGENPENEKSQASDSGEEHSIKVNRGNKAGPEMELELTEVRAMEEDPEEKESTDSEEEVETRLDQEVLLQAVKAESGRWAGQGDVEEDDDAKADPRREISVIEDSLLQTKEVARRSPEEQELPLVAWAETEEGSASQRTEDSEIDVWQPLRPSSAA